MEAERRFRAMGTAVHLVVHGDPNLLDLAESELERLEARWSRFRPASDISRLNAAAGAWVEVAPETITLVERALLAHTVTGGWFDPTVLGDVIRAGYDRDHHRLLALGDRPVPPASALRRGVDGIDVDATARAIRLAPGIGFDPGGLGKGLAADVVAARLDAEGVAGASVNVGGDLCAIGIAPGGTDWTVDLDPPASGRPVATVALERGAVATSTTLRRRWRIQGSERHHLIDPTTGEPTLSEVVSASVLAAHAWQAEVVATSALLAGVDDGLALAARLGTDALLVDRHGQLHPSPGFPRFVVAPLDAAVGP